MMRYLMKLKHKKGFTLTELIVVCAIIGILMVSLAAFSAPVRMMIKGVDAKSDCLTINKTIGDYLEHMLAYADDVEIYAGVELGDSATLAAINSAFANMQGDYDKKDIDRCAAIVFRFEAQSDVLKSGHRIYEIQGRNGGASVGMKKAIPSSFTKSDLLFYEDFYGPYSYFLAVDSGKVNNSVRRESFLKLTVKSYYFDGSDVDDTGAARHISEDDIESYYIHQDSPGVVADLMENKNNSASGSEEIFFPLQNIAWDNNSQTYWRGYTSGSVTTYGDDVVILYHVKRATYGSS